MILELDMGNTRIKWRLRDDSGKVARGNMSSSMPWSELAHMFAATSFNTNTMKRVMVSSVLGAVRNQDFHRWCATEFNIHPEFAVSQPTAASVTNGYLTPERLGVDRWLAILAGYALVRKACVIVDLGSALTVDLVNTHGQHLGGYIAPGLKIMRRALMANTEGILTNEVSARVLLAPGRDTESAVSAAQGAMYCGLLEHASLQLCKDACDSTPIFIMTGGDAEQLLPYFPDALMQPELVLDGLVLALPFH